MDKSDIKMLIKSKGFILNSKNNRYERGKDYIMLDALDDVDVRELLVQVLGD
jgi:hypothetical protein